MNDANSKASDSQVGTENNDVLRTGTVDNPEPRRMDEKLGPITPTFLLHEIEKGEATTLGAAGSSLSRAWRE